MPNTVQDGAVKKPRSATNPRLNGLLFGDWLRLLSENGFDVDRRYWPQAARVTAMSVLNTPLKRLEDLIYGGSIAAVEPPPPVFLLGHWRSGTTFLHRMMCQDEQFCTSNTWQAFHPHTFLLSEKLGTKIFDFSGKRDVDNVERGWHLAMEEDWGLGMMSLCSTIPMFAFPRNEAYERFITLRDASPEEVARFKAAMRHFVQKLAFKYGKPALLKSPAHTARIRHLLELFPKARFVHIHRDPYDLFKSMRKWMTTMPVNWFLQEPRYDVEEKLLSRYTKVYDAFFEDLPLIPKGQFCEIGYEELEREPLAQLRLIYSTLGLSGFEQAQPRFSAHAGSLADYRKNAHGDLPAELRAKISSRWERSFKAWGYAA